MDHTLGLLGGKALEKTVALIKATFGKGLFQSGFDTGNNVQRSHLPPHTRVGSLLGRPERRAKGSFICQAAGFFAGSAHLGQFAGIGNGCAQKICLNQVINQACGMGDFGADWRAFEHDINSHFSPTKPRQTLGAARAGDEPEVNFWQAYAGIRQRDAVMAAQSDFKAATECRAMQGSDHRLCRAFNLVNHFGQVRLSHWLAKFFDIGTRREGPAGAYDHNRCHLGVCFSLSHGVQQAFAHGLS